MIRPVAGETSKRLGLVVVRLDEGMRHRAEDRDAEEQLGHDRRGARESAR